jgi:xylulokinase
MAGFTAPKLMWVAANEPATFDRVDKVVLPKDWLVWQLTGVIGTDCSDAAGTLWLDVSKRVWSEAMLTASGMRLNQMPRLHEGSERVGCLLQHWASHWGLSSDVVVAAGAGDNAGGAVGVGVVHPGEGLISLGTSGVIFVATDGPQANPQRGVHTFCHALPNMWHQMAVLLSASSALSWWCNICGLEPAKILAMLPLGEVREGAPLFLPYLSGERTPHADPGATGSFHGLTHLHNRDDMSYAVLEGVAFAFADGMDALREAGSDPKRLLAIGGGARSDTWLQLLADVLCIQIDRPAGSDVGPALGAARLALLSMGIPFDDVMRPPSLAKSFYADAGRSAALQQRLTRYRSAYAPLRALSIY